MHRTASSSSSVRSGCGSTWNGSRSPTLGEFSQVPDAHLLVGSARDEVVAELAGDRLRVGVDRVHAHHAVDVVVVRLLQLEISRLHRTYLVEHLLVEKVDHEDQSALGGDGGRGSLAIEAVQEGDVL